LFVRADTEPTADELGLAELAAIDLRMARAFADRALAADDDETANALARSYQRMARSYRQTLALKARLERERRRLGREDQADSVRAREVRVALRKAQVKSAVERAVWDEYEAETEDAEAIRDRLDDHLAEASLYEDFCEEPVDVHIARVTADLGLRAEAAPAQGQPIPADGHWRSSA
jgi:hypothetical protein